MKNRYRLYCRSNGMYYSYDCNTGKQKSLKTKNKDVADRLMAATNQASDTAQLNRALAKIYASGSSPELMTRTWSEVMDAYAEKSVVTTRPRVERAFKSRPFERLRKMVVNETEYKHFREVLNHPKAGNSTNHFLHRLQNYAVAMRWLFEPVIVTPLWPKVKKKKTHGVAVEEHAKIIASEQNLEHRLYYQMLWETGGSQTDIANLHRDSVNTKNHTITFVRAKLDEREEGGEQCGLSKLVVGPRIQAILDQCPAQGYLFPILRAWSSGHRTTEFARRCRLAGVKNRQLKGYRYAWAQRAREAGMPEREAMNHLGHKSRAIHAAYAEDAKSVTLCLEHYEQMKAQKIVDFNLGQLSGDVESPAVSNQVN
jgi:integrase